ncbi:MAG: hypothetical protein RIQ93_2528 [Verrucomicrobiota bacterium]
MSPISNKSSGAQFENEQIVAPEAKRLLRKTRPIYLLPKGRSERDLKALGSGFFLRYLNRTVLVTASHVTRELEFGDLYVPTTGGSIESIGGRFYHTGLRSQPAEADRIDLAFIELPTELAARLPRDDYFTAAECDVADSFHEKSHYLICGWPGKRNQPNPWKPGSLPRAPISYLDSAHPPAAYAKYDLSSSTHYAVRFDPKRVMDDQGRLIRPPLLFGVSGSPCLFFHRYASRTDLQTLRIPKLVGVTIEVEKDAVVATRISLLFHLLKKCFEPSQTGARDLTGD